MIISDKRITKALIRLRGCADWSARVLFANHRRQIFLQLCMYLQTILTHLLFHLLIYNAYNTVAKGFLSGKKLIVYLREVLYEATGLDKQNC